MDTAYAKLGLPFAQALQRAVHRDLGVEGLGRWPTAASRPWAWTTATRRSRSGGVVLLRRAPDVRARRTPLRVGDRIRVLPAHVDPTVAYHDHLQVVDGEEVLERWAVDLRGW